MTEVTQVTSRGVLLIFMILFHGKTSAFPLWHINIHIFLSYILMHTTKHKAWKQQLKVICILILTISILFPFFVSVQELEGGYNNHFNGVASTTQNSKVPIRSDAPVFVVEPPNSVIFLSTTGAVVPCHIRSTMDSGFIVSWQVLAGNHDFVEVTNIPGLRQIREDGSLVLLPFKNEDFNPSIHSNTYRCIAFSSRFGVIGSRRMSVRSGQSKILFESLHSFPFLTNPYPLSHSSFFSHSHSCSHP